MHGPTVYVKEELCFAWDLSLENSAVSYLCFPLALLHSVSYFFLFYQSPFLSLYMVFDSISSNIQGGPKKCPTLLFIPKLCFTIFFHVSQVVQKADLRDSFDTNMDPTGRFTTQQPVKIIEEYCATKSVLLTQRQCRRDFDRNNAQ